MAYQTEPRTDSSRKCLRLLSVAIFAAKVREFAKTPAGLESVGLLETQFMDVLPTLQDDNGHLCYYN
jgi:hypothetical protein